MKFLTKRVDSKILSENLEYKENRASNNKRLKELLLEEQHNFCAYTEKYVSGLDSVEVEHFNASLKYNDDYYNYYAVLRKPNLYKQDEKYHRASFFQSLFFQNEEEFNRRIQYIPGDEEEPGYYMELEEEDTEASELIDFLGFNHHDLAQERHNQINRLRGILQDVGYSPQQYFRKYKQELSFITALEKELESDLSEFYEE